MKLLLTSAGFTNQTIIKAFRGLLDKPTTDAAVAVIPTAHNPEPGNKGWVITEDLQQPYELGWKQFDIIDLAAVYTLPPELWWDKLMAADVLLVGGGNVFYLSYWLQQSGLAADLPNLLQHKVYVGISAGSQVVCHSLQSDSHYFDMAGQLKDPDYDELGPGGQSSDQALGLTDFVFRPHLNSPHFPKIRLERMATVAAQLPVPMYVCDDASAVVVDDDGVRMVSKGECRRYA